ncbi:MAG TPA: hydroxysqualene dehydroxylase HpnE, partial [Bryobacteraceae bacterium]|nr:hydroxysqualene dehydroxylase HpnE [Bryobacteraceae bacterium]
MAEVIVAGGGLAGMAAAVALADAGHQVTLHEARGFTGGRAASYPAPAGGEVIDNCQHILLRCCVNLIDFYKRLGVQDRIRFHREFYFLEPGGRLSVLRAGPWPAPLHLAPSFSRLAFLGAREKLAIARALAAIRRESGRRNDLDRITMRDWLEEKRQPRAAVSRFWRPVLVSAVNAELEVMAARHGLQVFRLAFLARPDAFQMGIPSAPLGDLYNPEMLDRAGVSVRLQSPVERFRFEGHAVSGVDVPGGTRKADCYVCALPFEQLGAVAPELGLDLAAFHHSPITSVHLWFDRSITDLPHAALLDRTIQWVFNKSGGRYVQAVVSASASLVSMSRDQVVSLALVQLAEFFPKVHGAKLEKAHVVKELRATFSPQPGLERARPLPRTRFANLFLAGDWTRSGWPATMEGAVRSG